MKHSGIQNNLPVTVIGAGLAGSEAALQLASRGVSVRLFEMRPVKMTPAHHGALCAELVCSNSFKSADAATAAGTLKAELAMLESHVLQHAFKHRVPAGAALAVDRDAFAQAVQEEIENHPLIELIREEVSCLENNLQATSLVIVAAGPLASESLTDSLRELAGSEYLSFYDAAAPIVNRQSLDESRIFEASRYGKGDGADYLNVALDEEEYRIFYEALISAKRVKEKDFEQKELFAACQPIEEIARKGYDALRYGAMKPVGIDDPRTGRYPYALVQLRKETAAGKLYNLVGFQTNLTFPEQRRVFSLIPGFEQAEFMRYGVMHRNTFVDAPRTLNPDFSLQKASHIFLAGQICGTEGYLEAVGSGLICALNVFKRLQHKENSLEVQPAQLPSESTLGALLNYSLDLSVSDYQPMHVNFGLVPPLEKRIRNKRERYAAYSTRTQLALKEWKDSQKKELFSHG